MDAANSVTNARQVALDWKIQTAIMKKVLDTQVLHGQAVNTLLQTSVRLSKALGSGQRFDALA